MKRQLKISIGVLLFLIIGTILAVLYARGYRFGVDKGGTPQLSKTGILNAQSIPQGSNVWINDHLTTATNNTVNLTPGQYKVSIGKDGYHGWSKNVMIEKEVVTNTDATLWPQAPSLQSLSTFGIKDPVMDPSGSKLAFTIANQTPKKNGVYVLDMTVRSFPVLIGQSTSTQIASDTVDNFSKAKLSWSPDGEELIASVSSTFAAGPTYYLLKSNSLNDIPQDITPTLQTMLDTWQTQRATKEQARLAAIKPKTRQIIKDNFNIIAWSPDEKKILYQAKKTGQLPIVIEPRRIGNNLLYERRDLEKDAIYVYNIPEDVNTRIFDTDETFCNILLPTCTNHSLTWFPDSHHLIYVHDKKIGIVEEDGSNLTTIYAGPFEDHFVFPWPDGSRFVILTNLGNMSIPPTLYSVSLK